jgi:hypothetical protein
MKKSKFTEAQILNVLNSQDQGKKVVNQAPEFYVY